MLAAIVIPVYRESISKNEEISFRQCLSIFGIKYPIYLVTHENLTLKSYQRISLDYELHYPLGVKYFSSRFFESITGYNLLMLSPIFYRSFSAFEFALIYQLDAFVFEDRLEYWCHQGYAYVGAPWLEGWTKAEENAPFIGVGNGGFSLRKVSSHLKVLNSFSYIKKPAEFFSGLRSIPLKKRPYHFARILANLTIKNNTYHWFNSFPNNEDSFWGVHANQNFNWFLVPRVKKALQFSFEVQPACMYELNNHQLPFGCHAWWKYDLEFWKEHIEKFGYNIPDK